MRAQNIAESPDVQWVLERRVSLCHFKPENIRQPLDQRRIKLLGLLKRQSLDYYFKTKLDRPPFIE